MFQSHFSTIYQRWSPGHKARGQDQGQGHKKISRPRTDPLEAKAKDQEHRHKCSQKKRSSKSFFKRSQKKRSSKFFSGEKTISTRGKQKKVFADFPQGFWRFLTKF